jgi:hypothetical protein
MVTMRINRNPVRRSLREFSTLIVLYGEGSASTPASTLPFALERTAGRKNAPGMLAIISNALRIRASANALCIETPPKFVKIYEIETSRRPKPLIEKGMK